MKILPISILLLPSMRSLAYLHVFHELGVLPESCILMKGNIPHYSEIMRENEVHQYDQLFFNVKLKMDDYLSAQHIPTYRVDTDNVNANEVLAEVRRSPSHILIYTGGGILKKNILDLGKQFIHIHPGITPEYRGSTCFYYSLLNGNTVGATAFVMDRGIDTGAVIVQQEFSVNYAVRQNQPLFMDYILDSFIRASVLKIALEIYMNKGSLVGHPTTGTLPPPYYVMHPVLRHLAIQRLNAQYDPNAPAGIFPQQDQ